MTSPIDNEIVVIDGSGAIVNTIGLDGPPAAIDLTDDGNILVSVDRSVRKITTDGTELVLFGFVEDYFVDPHDVLFAPDGRVYVADDDDIIKVFDSAGAPLFTFGSYGYFNGRFDEPVTIEYNLVSAEIVVTDQNNHRIQTFDIEGDLQQHWGAEGNGLYAEGTFFRAFGMDVDGLGQVWTLDVLNDLVQVFDTAGAFMYSASLNTPDIRGGVDIAIDGNLLYVSSPSTNCVYVYGISTGTAPTNEPYELTILWTEAGAQLNWKPQPGAIGYLVQRSADLDFAEAAIEQLGVVTDTTFTDNFDSNPHTLCYSRVIAETNVNNPELEDLRLGDGHYRDPLDTEHDSPHHVTDGVNCNSCHLRPFVYPSPRPEWWFGDHLCKSCHVETGFAKAVQTHLGADTVRCGICHSPHYHQPQFERYFIRNENPVGESGGMFFNHATDFVHGAPEYDGICEICHTQTDYYRSNGKGAEHNPGSNCITCHT
ncbi:MAG: hypothetical protein IPP40_14650 [bacterium]|nr:hypothetical protein [bacterium]